MKLYITQTITKLIYKIINLLNIGFGYTWPGHIALKLYPNILKSKHIKFSKGVIVISGTNGKTTTAKVLTHLLASAGFSVTHNKTGANLLNGIVSAILLGGVSADFGVFEVDEFVLPRLLDQLPVDVLLLLNLSRDQLDRYGETDIIFDRWLASLQTLPATTHVLIDPKQPEFNAIPKHFKGILHTFDSDQLYLKKTCLQGTFNAKNVNAAVSACKIFDLPEDVIVSSLQTFEAAYGRGEILEYRGKQLHLLLSKNPASLNHNLVTSVSSDALFFILNDNIPDGRDVSWIYDVDATLLCTACLGKQIFVSGTRYLDMAIRLRYAGVVLNEDNMCKVLSQALAKISKSDSAAEVLVLPNYSAMLELRKVLLGRSIL